MQRMDCEHCRDKRASPKGSGHLPKNEKQHDHGGAMQHQAGEMVPTRAKPEELDIEHMRDGRERMPVLGMNVGKRPGDPMERDSISYRGIGVEIRDVIVVDELVPERLAENDPRQRH